MGVLDVSVAGAGFCDFEGVISELPPPAAALPTLFLFRSNAWLIFLGRVLMESLLASLMHSSVTSLLLRQAFVSISCKVEPEKMSFYIFAWG